MMALSYVLVFLMAAVSIEGTRMRRLHPSGETDLVVGLPGQPSVNFKHYAGYVSVSEHRSLFYWFFEAMEAPATKPLVLWLNGGPGCSSVAGGAISEVGPFLVTDEGSGLRFNPYAWNKGKRDTVIVPSFHDTHVLHCSSIANLLFLDSPVGVGFSYSDSSSDAKNLNDQITAEDTHAFLIYWFLKHPDFKSQELYLVGESYAGHYAPQLAEVIDERNKGAKDSYINLKGLMIGNPLIDVEEELRIATIDFAWKNGYISDNLYQAATTACTPVPGSNCPELVYEVEDSFSDIMFGIYSPTCSKFNTIKNEIGSGLATEATGYDPCSTDNAEVYLSREDVQRALHANLTRLPYPYSFCSMDVHNAYNQTVPTVLPLLRKLIDAGYRMWIYSGDTDGRVTIPVMRRSINKMNLSEKAWDKWGGWKKWYYEAQVAGWMVEYTEGLTFITVRGAGHMVPAFSPGRGLALISNFLKGEPMPFKDTQSKDTMH
ncbi:unnamed protein product [Musa banksii]